MGLAMATRPGQQVSTAEGAGDRQGGNLDMGPFGRASYAVGRITRAAEPRATVAG